MEKIDIRDLRVGNLVNILRPRHGEKHLVIHSISIDGVNSEFREYSIKELIPIPLVGQIREDAIKSLTSLEVEFTPEANGIISIYIQGYEKSFKYVHKLQNFIYEILEDELDL